MVQKRRGTAYLLAFLAFMAIALGGLYMAFDQAVVTIADEATSQAGVVPQTRDATGNAVVQAEIVPQTRVVGGVEYPVNKNGQTYGSSENWQEMLDGLSGEQEKAMTKEELIALLPDLVIVRAWDGTSGYIPSSDFYDACYGLLEYTDGKTPAEVVAGLDAFNSRTWPMYAEDGVTIIGEFGGDISESDLFFTD